VKNLKSSILKKSQVLKKGKNQASGGGGGGGGLQPLPNADDKSPSGSGLLKNSSVPDLNLKSMNALTMKKSVTLLPCISQQHLLSVGSLETKDTVGLTGTSSVVSREKKDLGVYGGVDEEFIIGDKHDARQNEGKVKMQERIMCSKLSPFMSNYCPKLHTSRDVYLAISPHYKSVSNLLTTLKAQTTNHRSLSHAQNQILSNNKKSKRKKDDQRFMLGLVILLLFYTLFLFPIIFILLLLYIFIFSRFLFVCLLLFLFVC
jgi:hypothetical protein